MAIHSCTLSSNIERILFEPNINSIENNHIVPDDICPICLNNLKESIKNSCCGTYSRKLNKCGHWVHVSCQIDKNVNNRHECSICRMKIVDKEWLDHKIIIGETLNILPIHYQMKFRKDGIDMFDDINVLDDLKKYGFNENNIKDIKNVFDLFLK